MGFLKERIFLSEEYLEEWSLARICKWEVKMSLVISYCLFHNWYALPFLLEPWEQVPIYLWKLIPTYSVIFSVRNQILHFQRYWKTSFLPRPQFHFLKLPFCWKQHGISFLVHCCSAMFSLALVLFIFSLLCACWKSSQKIYSFSVHFYMLIISLLFGIFVYVCTIIELIRLQLMIELSIERFCGCLFLLFGPLF